MSEHTHDWYISNFPRGAACKVKDCNDLLGIGQIQDQLNSYAALEAKLSKMEELESERDMLRTVLEDTDKAELLEALEQSTKEALALRERIKELETEGCGQCEACEDFFPLSLLSITDDGVALCPGDWDEVLAATAELAEEEA